MLEGFARKDFLVQNQRSLPCWPVAFASAATLYSMFGSLARFHSQSPCWSQSPRVLCGGTAPLSSSLAPCPFVMSTYTFWPTIPQFHPRVPSLLSSECHLVLVIYLRLVCQLGIKSLAHLFTAIWIGISAPSVPKDSLEVGILWNHIER